VSGWGHDCLQILEAGLVELEVRAFSETVRSLLSSRPAGSVASISMRTMMRVLGYSAHLSTLRDDPLVTAKHRN
jgi:hypothetical protein